MKFAVSRLQVISQHDDLRGSSLVHKNKSVVSINWLVDVVAVAAAVTLQDPHPQFRSLLEFYDKLS